MSPNDTEVDRLRRLRDKQLEARDPGKKERRLQQSIATRQRSSTEPTSVGSMWKDIPHSWKGLLYGGLVGAAIIIGLPYLLDYPWLETATLVAFPFFVVLGFFIGRAADTRDRIKEYVR